MGKFIKYILLFSIPNIFMLAMLEGYIRSCPNEYSIKREWMDEHATEVKTLILGSSYADWEFNPELIGDSCFNLAIPTRTVKYDCFLLEIYNKLYGAMVIKYLTGIIITLTFIVICLVIIQFCFIINII